MKRVLVALAFPWLVLGCAASSDDLSDSQAKAFRCAKSWKARGFSFDPNAMTCSDMFGRVQAIRNAAYWQKQGYVFDPHSMTANEMDRAAGELRQKGLREYHYLGKDAPAKTASVDQAAHERLRRRLQGMTIGDVRGKYPQYGDMDDMELARRIHAHYFSETPFAEFARRFLGYEP